MVYAKFGGQTKCIMENAKIANRAFYSFVLSYQAFEGKRGWSWPCFDTNLTAFLM